MVRLLAPSAVVEGEPKRLPGEIRFRRDGGVDVSDMLGAGLMADTIKKVMIEGFKSIRKLEDFELGALNVLIGANGAGKSNFVSFFRFLRDLIQQRLQTAIAVDGGADGCLFLGPKETPQLTAKLYFGENGYEFSLVPTHDGRLVFSQEFTIS